MTIVLVASLSGIVWWTNRGATRLIRERALKQKATAHAGSLMRSKIDGPRNTARPTIHLESLVARLPGALAIFDTEMRYLALSQGWRDYHGLGARPLIGLRHYEVCPDVSPRWRHVHSRALAGEVLSERADHVERRHGEGQPLKWHLAPWRDESGRIGGITIASEDSSMVGVACDVTERERAEAAIRAGESRLRHALDAAQAGVWEWDPSTDHNYWSEEVFRLYGLDPSNASPTYETWLQTVHPVDREMAIKALNTAVAQRSELTLEWRVNTGADPERWLLSRGKPSLDAAGRPTSYSGIVVDITNRKRAERALRDSEQRYRTMFRTSPDAVTITRRADGLYLEVNDGFARMFGWSVEEVVGRTSNELGIWQDLADRKKFFDELNRSGHCSNIETTFLTKERHAITALLSSCVISIQGESCILTVTRDITDRKASETQLRKLSQAVEQSPESIIITNVAGQIEYVNQAFSRTSGYSSAETLGRTADFLTASSGRCDTIQGLREAMAKGEPWCGEFHNRRKSGAEYTEFAIVAPIRQDDGKVTHYVAVQQDITERLQAERKIQHLAYYDQLTGLPNRTLLADRLKQALGACARLSEHGALMMIDLDDFKQLNDTFGHDMGDELLKQVAGRMRACVRRGDTLARLGGDEFMLVMAGMSGNPKYAAHYAQTVAQKILASFRSEFQLSAGTHHCTASIGIALFTGDLLSSDDLMKQADLALYQAKALGRDAVCFFDPQMESTARQRSALERDLRRGLETHQFLLHYQPQVDGAGRIIGVEALVRWQHPVRGLVPPAEFIPVAEESGLIVPLGQEIFAMALAQLVRWSERDFMASLTVAVNVSARQIRQADFVEQVLAALRVSGADPAALKLEITESLLVENTEAIIAKIVTLKGHGVGFSIDDFGIGYSSLSYLKRLPLDQMKIDQSFVRDVLTDSNDAAIARTIIGLAGNLSLGVIAEGVETEAQREFLAGAGCQAFQGYLFSTPLPPEALEEFVAKRRLTPAEAGAATSGA